MSDFEKKKVDYVVMVVFEYAREMGISVKQAFVRLLDCGGIEALNEFYDIEHTLPLSQTVRDLDILYTRSGSYEA